jgi:hypothetical protein
MVMVERFTAVEARLQRSFEPQAAPRESSAPQNASSNV